jgi:hypothetical protein
MNIDSDNNICIFDYQPKRQLNTNNINHYHESHDGNIFDVFYDINGHYTEDDITTGERTGGFGSTNV